MYMNKIAFSHVEPLKYVFHKILILIFLKMPLPIFKNLIIVIIVHYANDDHVKPTSNWDITWVITNFLYLFISRSSTYKKRMIFFSPSTI
jgi:hypothetical protein